MRTTGTRSLYERFVKRWLDVALSLLGLVCLCWLFLLVAVAVVADDPGPVFFTQKRVGRNGRYFRMHKFRTMKTDAPPDTPTHLLDNPERYITRVGRILRMFSLDELPQIWDILAGHMSVIGPRPALWTQDDLVRERERYGVNAVRPGLTGWAQINGRDRLEIPEKARFDGEYAAALCQGGWTAFRMDAKCFFGTIAAVLRRAGVAEGRAGAAKEKK